MHPSNKVTLDNLADVMTYHAPQGDQVERYRAINDEASKLVEVILASCPDCADRSAAIRCVREARMWANASIALDHES